ncbi:hypothetical protein ACVTKE_003166, partial [Enterobacter asburiae]
KRSGFYWDACGDALKLAAMTTKVIHLFQSHYKIASETNSKSQAMLRSESRWLLPVIVLIDIGKRAVTIACTFTDGASTAPLRMAINDSHTEQGDIYETSAVGACAWRDDACGLRQLR